MTPGDNDGGDKSEEVVVLPGDNLLLIRGDQEDKTKLFTIEGTCDGDGLSGISE